jgi:hypothetical protein
MDGVIILISRVPSGSGLYMTQLIPSFLHLAISLDTTLEKSEYDWKAIRDWQRVYKTIRLLLRSVLPESATNVREIEWFRTRLLQREGSPKS